MADSARVAAAKRLDDFERRAAICANDLALKALDNDHLFSTYRITLDDLGAIPAAERDECMDIVSNALDKAFDSKLIRDKYAKVQRRGYGTYYLERRF